MMYMIKCALQLDNIITRPLPTHDTKVHKAIIGPIAIILAFMIKTYDRTKSENWILQVNLWSMNNAQLTEYHITSPHCHVSNHIL